MEFDDGAAIWASAMSAQHIDQSEVDEGVVSDEFRAGDADLKIRSCDDMLFKVHQRTIDKYSEGLLGDGVPNSRGEFELKEDSKTLELLFQYMYRKRPDIGSISFDMLRSVADAADVYQMDAFGERCDYQMRSQVRAHPMDVLAYATKRKLSDVVDEAAPRTIGTDVETALQALGRETFIPWILYREKWIHIMRDANDPPVVIHKGGIQSCDLWYTYHRSVTNDLRNFGPGEVQEGRSVFGRYRSSLKNCTHCKIRADNWARAFEAAPERMPTFSSVVSETTR